MKRVVSMNKEKGGLIKKKTPIMRPAVTVTKKQDADFGFDVPVKKETKKSATTPAVAPVKKSAQPLVSVDQLNVGTKVKTKSVKVPEIIHTELGLLGSFTDESKTYVILQKLIDSYVEHELTDRQQRQFKFMVDAFNQEQ